MDPAVAQILLGLVSFIIAEARRAKMTNDEIKVQLGIDVEEFNAKNPGIIPEFQE